MDWKKIEERMEHLKGKLVKVDELPCDAPDHCKGVCTCYSDEEYRNDQSQDLFDIIEEKHEDL